MLKDGAMKLKKELVSEQIPLNSYDGHWFTGPIAEAFTNPKLSAKDYIATIATATRPCQYS